MNTHNKLEVKDGFLTEVLNHFAVKLLKDFDGDIVKLQGHSYFVHTMHNILCAINPEGLSIGNKLWKVFGQSAMKDNSDTTLIIFADTAEAVKDILIENNIIIDPESDIIEEIDPPLIDFEKFRFLIA